MGRTSLAPERRVHILHADISCMAQFGMKGTTLDRVAEVANRDEMIVDAAKVFFFGDFRETGDENYAASAFIGARWLKQTCSR